jgi:hypothetical protein
MKKKLIFLSLLAMIGLSSFGQLKVVNNFGCGLNVENGGKVIFIPDKGIATFPTRIRTADLSCWTLDSKIKFVISREVSRAGVVKIEASDRANVPVQTNPIIYDNASNAPVNNSEKTQPLSAILSGSVGYSAPVYNNSSTHYSDSINDLSGSKTSYEDVDAMNKNSNVTVTSVGTPVQETSLSAILKGDVGDPEPTVSAAVPVQTKSVQTIVSRSVTYAGEPITLEYLGTKTLKIISSEGQGLELIGRADSVNNSGVKNKYTIYVKKNADLVIGIGEKKQANQAIWPYGEIRKRINADDAVCKITDADIKMMSTNQTRKLKFRVDAKGYKILIEPDSGELISLGYCGVSRPVDLPIGQSYIRIAYTDPQGVFHPTAFMSVHVTSQDRYIPITANDLAKTFTINNW